MLPKPKDELDWIYVVSERAERRKLKEMAERVGSLEGDDADITALIDDDDDDDHQETLKQASRKSGYTLCQQAGLGELNLWVNLW